MAAKYLMRKYLSIIVGFILIVPALFYAQDVNTDSLFNKASFHHEKGIELIAAGKRIEGMKELNLSVTYFSEHLNELQQKKDSLRVVYTAMLENAPESPVLYYLLGRCDYLDNFWKKLDSTVMLRAKKNFEKSLQLAPDCIAGYLGLAEISNYFNNKEEEISLYRKVLEIDPLRYRTRWRLSLLLDVKGKKQEAKELRDKIIAADSSSTFSIRCMITMAEKEEKKEKKIKLLDSALRLAKNNDDRDIVIQSICLLCFKDAADYSESVSLKVLNDPLLKQQRSIRMRALDNLCSIYIYYKKNMIPGFEKIALNDDNPKVLMELGRYYADSLKENEKALKVYLNAYRIITPETVINTFCYGSGKGFYEKSKKEARDLKEGTVAFIIGRIYYEQKKHSEAEKYLLESVIQHENRRSNAPHFLLAKLKLETNKKNEAIRWFARGLALENDEEEMKKLNVLLAELKIPKKGGELIKEERVKLVNEAANY